MTTESRQRRPGGQTKLMDAYIDIDVMQYDLLRKYAEAEQPPTMEQVLNDYAAGVKAVLRGLMR